MKKVGILIEEMFNEQELIYPYHRLREDYEVLLIGSEADTTYSSKAGVSMKSDVASKDVKASELEAIVIPGGFSPDFMRRAEETIELVKEVREQGKPVAAICHGPWVLASALDLEGVKMTSFMSIRHDLENAGAKWSDETVINDNGIITSRNPGDLPAFMKELLKELE